MPNPKRRHSKKRGRLRRTFYKAKRVGLSKCPHCGKPRMPHRICPFCGFYKGIERVEVLTKDEKRKKREKRK